MRVTEEYVASDGERVQLSVEVTGCATEEETIRKGHWYFREFGYRVVESAKAAGRWPLEPDHPNYMGR